MAEGTAVASENTRTEARNAYLSYLRSIGISERDALVMADTEFTAAEQQAAFTEAQAKSITKFYVEARQKIGDQTSANIVGLGNTAGTQHLQSQQKAADALTSLDQLAGATEMKWKETEGNFYAGWAGPITMIGKILNACGATEWGNKCIEFANDLRPKEINNEVNKARMDKRQSQISYNVSVPQGYSLQSVSSALLMTNPKNVGITKDSAKEGTAAIGATAEGATEGAKVSVGRPADTPKPDAGKSNATSGVINLNAISSDIAKRATDKHVNLPEGTRKAVVQAIGAADANKDGLIKDAEVTALRGSAAYDSLDFDQRRIVDKTLGVQPSLKDKALSYLPGYNLQ